MCIHYNNVIIKKKLCWGLSLCEQRNCSTKETSILNTCLAVLAWLAWPIYILTYEVVEAVNLHIIEVTFVFGQGLHSLIFLCEQAQAVISVQIWWCCCFCTIFCMCALSQKYFHKMWSAYVCSPGATKDIHTLYKQMRPYLWPNLHIFEFKCSYYSILISFMYHRINKAI